MSLVGQVWRQRFAQFDDLFVIVEVMSGGKLKLLDLEQGHIDYVWEWSLLENPDSVWERIA